MKTVQLIASAITLAAITAFAVPDGWTDDFGAAKERAAKEGKLMLVDFTGSDWCRWCRKLDSEVFSKKEFVDGASKEYVLVMIDLPRDKSRLSEKAKEQNPKLREQYDIQGFPSVLIMDADGNVIAKTGYTKGGPEAYIEHLARARKTAAAKAVLEKAISGLPKGDAVRLAKIDEFLGGLDDRGLWENKALLMELLADDKDEKFARKYPYFGYVVPFQKKIADIERTSQSDFIKRAKEMGESATDEQKKALVKEFAATQKKLFAEGRKEAEAIKVRVPEAGKDLDDYIEFLDGVPGFIDKETENVEKAFKQLIDSPLSGANEEVKE